MKTSLLSLFMFLSLVGCGSKDNNNEAEPLAATEGQFAGKAFRVVNGKLDESTDQSLKGTAEILFDAPLKGVRSAHSFKITFKLEDNDQLQEAERQHLSLTAFSDKGLNGGAEFKFTRLGNKLLVSMCNVRKKCASEVLEGVDPSQDISLLVDVHNDHDDGSHILIWKADQEHPDGKNKLVSIRQKGKKGISKFWGLKLVRSIVTGAELGEPVHRHCHHQH